MGMTKKSDEDALGALQNLTIDNLKAFAAMNKLKKASLNVIATQLTDSSIKDLKDAFVAMDENNDGTLSVSELREGLIRANICGVIRATELCPLHWCPNRMSGPGRRCLSFGTTSPRRTVRSFARSCRPKFEEGLANLTVPPNLQQLMECVDTDGSGVIDYSEFLAATMDMKKYMQEDVCWSAFKVFDLDGNGTIDRSELASVLGSGEMRDMLGPDKTIDDIMKEVDVNGDGTIDFEEFMAMMRKHGGPVGGSKKLLGSSSNRADGGDTFGNKRSSVLGSKKTSPRASVARGGDRRRSSAAGSTANKRGSLAA